MYGLKPGVSADHCGVAMGVLEQRIDSVGAADRWRDRTGALDAEGRGSAVVPVRFHGPYWYLVPVLVVADKGMPRAS